MVLKLIEKVPYYEERESEVLVDAAIDISMDIIKKWEGFKAKAYKCQAGVWTTGYGRTGPDVTESTVTTKQAEEVWLRKRVETEISWIRQTALTKAIGEKLNDNQVAALVSLVYNIGRGGFLGSGVRRFLLQGKEKEALARWLKWNKVGGLENKGLNNRRAAEIALYTTPPEAK